MIDRIVLVTKPTALDGLIAEYQTRGAAAFILESKGDSIARYDDEHLKYEAAIATLRESIPLDIDSTAVTRNQLQNFLFRDNDLIVACGPDGLFVNLAQFVQQQLIIGINPDRSTITGKLMPFEPSQLKRLIGAVRSGSFKSEQLPFVKATIDGRQEVWGINDIFVGRADQVSARYVIAYNQARERHSSSGVIISTAVGSSGWLRSVGAMLDGLFRGEVDHPLKSIPLPTECVLRFVVREPFPSPFTQCSLVTGQVTPGTYLAMVSEMPQGGVVFSDGNLESAVDWPAGSTAVLTVGERMLCRVIG